MEEPAGVRRQVKPWVAIVAIAAALVFFGGMWLVVGIGRLDREFGPARRTAKAGTLDVRANDLAMKLNLAGNSYYKAGMCDSAMACYREALRVAEKAGNTRRMAASYHDIGNIFDYENLPESARFYRNAEIALNRAAGIWTRLSDDLIDDGLYRFRSLGDVDSGRVLLEKGLARCRQVGDRRREALALYGLASLHATVRQYDSAQVLFESCAAVSHEQNDRSTESGALHSLGLIYLRHDRLDDAKPWLLRAIEVAHSGRVVDEEASALFDIACIRAEQGDRELARANAEQAFKLYEQAADNGGMNACRNLLAELEDAARSEYRERMLDSLLEQRKSQPDLGM